MIADDLQALYMLLRGSRSAIQVLDAKALVQEQKFTAAHEKLIDSRESYMETRSRLMKQDAATTYKGTSKEDERNRRTLVRKQEKTREIQKAFEELMPAIERLSKREQQTAAAEKEAARVEAVEPEAIAPATPSPADAPEKANAIELLAKPSDVTDAFLDRYRSARRSEAGRRQRGVWVSRSLKRRRHLSQRRVLHSDEPANVPGPHSRADGRRSVDRVDQLGRPEKLKAVYSR